MLQIASTFSPASLWLFMALYCLPLCMRHACRVSLPALLTNFQAGDCVMVMHMMEILNAGAKDDGTHPLHINRRAMWVESPPHRPTPNVTHPGLVMASRGG